MPTQESQPQTPTDGALDLGEIEPGLPAGYPPPAEGAHPWSPSEFDRRANAERDAAVAEWDRLNQLVTAASNVLRTLRDLRQEAAYRARSLGADRLHSR